MINLIDIYAFYHWQGKSLPDEYYRIAGNIFVALNDSVIEGILIKL